MKENMFVTQIEGPVKKLIKNLSNLWNMFLNAPSDL